MHGSALAFSHLNLRRNPFGAIDPDEQARLAVLDVDAFARWLRPPRRALQVLGESGHGKTTHLRALAAAIPHAAFVRFRPGGRPRSAPQAPVLLLDEPEWLAAADRRRLLSRAASFGIGSHVDHGAELAAAGFEVSAVRLDDLSPDRFAAICERRIETARRGPGPVPRVPAHVIAALVARFGADIRSALDLLYDAIQRMEGPGDVEV